AGLVVKLVERVAERRVQVLQIGLEHEREPEGLGYSEVQISQDVELELRAPVHGAPKLRRLWKDRDERRAHRAQLWPDRVQSFQLHLVGELECRRQIAHL